MKRKRLKISRHDATGKQRFDDWTRPINILPPRPPSAAGEGRVRVFTSELRWDHFVERFLMPPTPIESVRPWFLALPQLQKTLVFGGLGMLSGWGTTVSLAGWRANSPPDFGILVAAVVVPGLAFSVLVTGPLYVLNSTRLSGWLQSLLLVTVLHPVAVIGYALLSAYVAYQPLLPLHVYCVAGAVGASFGFLLAGCCSPTHWAREFRTVLVTSLGMGLASVAVAVGMTRNLVFLLAFSPALQSFFHVALTLVTLHMTAAICLSWREWPEQPKVAPPPLDNPATLPP